MPLLRRGDWEHATLLFCAGEGCDEKHSTVQEEERNGERHMVRQNAERLGDCTLS